MANQSEDQSSAELIGSLVTNFFSFGGSDDPPPPNVCREMIAEQLQKREPVAVRRTSVHKMTKEQRLKMEADLMGGSAAPIPNIVRQRSGSDSSSPQSTKLRLSEALVHSPEGDRYPLVESSSGRWEHSESPELSIPSLSASPPGDFPPDQELGSISANDSHSPSPEIDPIVTRSRSGSQEVPPAVVRRRARSKEERQAEEQDLMKEFRRRDLSTWLSSGELNGASDTVEFVPYIPYQRRLVYSLQTR